MTINDDFNAAQAALTALGKSIAALPPPPASVPLRNPLLRPFAVDSIWNMPIGSGAVYVPLNLKANPSGDVWTPMPQVDGEYIVLKPTAPLANIYYSDAGWSGRNRCAPTGGLLASVPIPSGYVV